MGKKNKKLLALLWLVVLMMAGIESTRALSLCKMDEAGIEACKPYVMENAPPNTGTTPPSGECCNALAGADFQCLCGYKGSPMLKALGIDLDRALALPSKCDPPINAQC